MELLKNSSELYYDLLEEAPLGITVIDIKGNILLVNPAMLEILGSPSAEATKAINMLEYPPIIRSGISHTLKKSFDTGEKHIAEHFYTSKWGKSVYMRMHINPLRASWGQITGAQMLVEDITERKKVEKELDNYRHNLEEIIEQRTFELEEVNKQLSYSEERFSKAFNMSPNLMSIISLKDYRIISINHAWKEVLGYDEDEFIGENLFNSNNIKNFEEVKEEVTRKEKIHNLEIVFYTKSGEERTGLLSGDSIIISEEKCFLCVINDITEFNLMKNEINRLERLNVVGEMAAGIAHEIRNPITTIRGFIQILKNKEELSYYQSYLELLFGELEKINSKVTELLSLSKNQKPQKEESNINEIIKKLYPLIYADVMNASQDIKLDLEDVPNLFIDEKEIRQLILNLVRNGIEAMPPARCLTIKTFQYKDQAVLAIKDQGYGVGKEELDKVKIPFYTNKANGTGLGLAMCDTIAYRNNAVLDIKSNSSGTIVYVYFRSNNQRG